MQLSLWMRNSVAQCSSLYLILAGYCPFTGRLWLKSTYLSGLNFYKFIVHAFSYFICADSGLTPACIFAHHNCKFIVHAFPNYVCVVSRLWKTGHFKHTSFIQFFFGTFLQMCHVTTRIRANDIF